MKLVEAFKNPVSRPRAIIWTGTILSLVCLLFVVMFFATTSYWFCAEICHKVQTTRLTPLIVHRTAKFRAFLVTCPLMRMSLPMHSIR